MALVSPGILLRIFVSSPYFWKFLEFFAFRTCIGVAAGDSFRRTMSLVNQVRNAGVVGAGGGGFPAHVKLAAKADTIIANGAECEPLLHKDAAVLEHRAKDVVRGILLCADALGAGDVVIAIKAKKKAAVAAATAACEGTRARVHLLGDYYPAGDEYDLVHSVTGRLIPPAGIPLNVGVVVMNVESLANVAAAADGKPVTRKIITIAGAVANPASFEVPIGISLRECIAAAGGATVPVRHTDGQSERRRAAWLRHRPNAQP